MRYKGTLAIIACLGLLAATLYTLPQTPVYKASTIIEIQNHEPGFHEHAPEHPRVRYLRGR